MKTTAHAKRLLSVALLLMATASAVSAQDIYKCNKGGQVAYTDRPCPAGKGALIHQADDSEIIDQYLDLGQDAVAQRYADSHHLDSLYKERLEARRQRMQAKARQQAAQDAADKQQEAADRQQAAVDAAASRGRLQGENDALRQQNAAYQNQLAQPAYNDAGPYYNAGPGYWGGGPPYGYPHHPGGPPVPPTPPAPPVFHPCVPIAGGTVKC